VGESGGAEWTVEWYVIQAIRLAAAAARSLLAPRRGTALELTPSGARSRVDAIPSGLPLPRGGLFALEAAVGSLELAEDVPVFRRIVGDVLLLVDEFLDAVRLRLDDLIRADDEARRAWYLIDLLLAGVRGVVADGVMDADDFNLIDDWEFRDWLMRHGAMRESVDCAIVRSVVYGLAFAFEDGDPQRPACGAGTALRGLLRLFFTYRGSIMWKMNAGMGDVVFAPLFEVLHRRGVDVKFFHRVEELHVEAMRVTRVDIDIQAKPRRGITADAFVRADKPGSKKKKQTPRWPSDPKELVERPLGVQDPDPSVYESYWNGVPRVAQQQVVVDRNDIVVFGLSIGCVPYVARQLVDRDPRWRATVDHIKTVPTQALQLWLDRDVGDLGPWAEDVTLGGFVEPFDTWADMTKLRDEEGGRARSIAYFCNVMPATTHPPGRGTPGARRWRDRQNSLVRHHVRRFVERDLPVLWPEAVDPSTGEFDWQLLHVPDADKALKGPQRLDRQFVRANIEPSELYVLSVPGSSRHRIPPDSTGFSNLFAVGDWTECTLNSGCVEAAVISGMVAANAINSAHKGPVEKIIGWDHP
jgi:hypothetical protein